MIKIVPKIEISRKFKENKIRKSNKSQKIGQLKIMSQKKQNDKKMTYFFKKFQDKKLESRKNAQKIEN